MTVGQALMEHVQMVSGDCALLHVLATIHKPKEQDLASGVLVPHEHLRRRLRWLASRREALAVVASGTHASKVSSSILGKSPIVRAHSGQLLESRPPYDADDTP